MNFNGEKNNSWRSRNQFSRSGEPSDSPQARKIIFTSMVVVSLAFIFLAAKLWHMQVLTGEHYRKLSENNRIRLVDMPPNRGLIFDSQGRLLADNRPAFTLEVVPEDVSDWKLLTKRLGQLVGITPEEIKKARRQAMGQPPFKPVRLRSNLDRHQLAVLETFRYELAGVRVKVEYRRAYHAPYTTAHLIGYLGEINKKELQSASRTLYRMGDFVGRSGLEKSRERVLHGRRGARQVEVDVMGRELAVLKRAEPHPGHNLKLTIDLKLQEAAARALGDEAGGVVAMNPNNGQVLCLYSSPSFDQNLFMTGMTEAQWGNLSKNEKKPLKDRAVSGLYPPGSTYKIITAAAGLAEGVVTPETSFFCAGQIPFGRRYYRCWAYKKGGHGHTNLKKALRESCDVYFYKVGLKLGVDRLAKYAKAFGLGAPSGVPLPHESGGLVPTSKWKKKRFGVRWQDGETLSVAIGQSFNLTTPMQLCRMISVIANGGRLVTPTLVKEVIPADGSPPVPEPAPLSVRVPVKPEHIKLIQEGLVAVINEPGGTARRVKLPGITVAGKTGTAQVVSLKLEKSFGKEKDIPWKYRAHGLFVCYAPAEKPEIAVAAVVEHGLHGGSAAGPVARAILKAYFNIQEPEKDADKNHKAPAPAGAGQPPGAPPRGWRSQANLHTGRLHDLIDRRMILNFDWLLLGLLCLLAGVGALNLYSAASTFSTQGTPIYLKQLYWFGLGVAVMLAMAMVGYQRLSHLAYPLYGVAVLALAAVLLWGKVVGGSQRWLALGPLVVQPSEMARLTVILALASYFGRNDQDEACNLRQLVIPVGIMLVPAVLILKEPDLGTCLLTLIIGGSVILANGVKLSSLGIATGGMLAILPVAWRFLKDYQKRRIFSFLDPESDPLGASYHLIQSKIAIGSGQFWGKGYMEGTQSQLHFLPEQHTDFAFSVLAEEWGYIGALVVIILLAAIIFRGLTHAWRAKDKVGMLIVMGAVASVFWPAIINMGMVLGLFPVVGIPLPFISYGGSNLVTHMAAMGLIQGVAMRRFVFHRR